MFCKPISWTKTALFFLWLQVCYFGFAALRPTLRAQMGSMYSEFWQFIYPSSLVFL